MKTQEEKTEALLILLLRQKLFTGYALFGPQTAFKIEA